ncbi:hypothetical protein [Pseudoalteromonas piscicida]|nr:hypothetical protein [Pseudoalteromonas piscicida]
MTTAQASWRRLRGFKLLTDVIDGKAFKDGICVTETVQQTDTQQVIHQN